MKFSSELLTTCLILFICAMLFYVTYQRDLFKQEAVDRGFAEWIVKGKNNTEFKWKEKQ